MFKLWTRLAVPALVIGCVAVALAGDKDKGAPVDTSPKAPAAAPASDATAAANEAALAAVAPYIGEWRIKAKWAAGNDLEGREVFTWGVGKKFVHCKTFVNKPDGGGEYQRYETIFGAKDGKLMAWAFTFDGKADLDEFKIDGKRLYTSKPMAAQDGGTGTLHQSIELVDPNKFRWLVSFEKDGKTQPLMDGMWIREGSSSASTAK